MITHDVGRLCELGPLSIASPPLRLLLDLDQPCNNEQCSRPLSDGIFNRMSQINGGAGRIRTADKQFRKLLLYPSELQPHASIVILLAKFRSLCVRHGDGRVVGGSPPNPGAIFVTPNFLKIVGQYCRSALLAVFKPIRIP
jgi:hypothetical protein